jgi:polar amino acid transport system substrate-binding protein
MRRFVAVYLSCLSLHLPVFAQNPPETVLERIARTGALRVGIREDAAPLGYRDINDRLAGVCLDYVYYLRDRLREELKLEILSVFLVRSTLFNRFYLVEDRVVDIECGPNTIQSETGHNVTFSQPFFITQGQFLIRAEDRSGFNPKSSLENVRLGVLRYSTTQTDLQAQYPQAKIQEFQGYRGRTRGVQALQNRQIDAFISDGILLLGEAILQNLPLGTEYMLVANPTSPCEFYGMILPANDPEWQTLIDKLISTEKAGEVLRNWFDLVVPYLQDNIRTCLPNSPRLKL